MSNAHLFLDTNVFIGYCHPRSMREEANNCQRVMECDNPKHICEIVDSELERFIRRSKQLYIDLQAHLSQGNPIETFPLFQIPESLRGHFRDVVRFAQDQPRAIPTALRNLGSYVDAKLFIAKNRIEQPVIENIQDKTHAIELELRCDDGFHPPDSDIINNFIRWVPSVESAKYITNDGGIIRNIPTIEAYIEDNVPRTCSVELIPLDRFNN